MTGRDGGAAHQNDRSRASTNRPMRPPGDRLGKSADAKGEAVPAGSGGAPKGEDRMDAELQEMLDHHRIRKALADYCRGVDRVDEPLMASVYAEDSFDDHGTVKAPGPEYCSKMCDSVVVMTETLHHTLGQSTIRVNGDEAGAETYFIAVARETTAEGVRLCNQLGGRFADRLVRENGQWKVKHRIVLRDWSVAIPLDHDWEMSNTLTKGQRSGEDATYAVLGTTHGGRIPV